MPLYMDIHNLPEGTTPEDVAKAHAKDMEIQRKYGVEYHKYWVNEAGNKVFCLAHAPNAEAAECVHREAHGMMAEKIIEVEPDVAEVFLGGTETNPAGAVLLPDGGADDRDPGIRTILFTDVVNSTTLTQLLGDEAALALLGVHDTIVRDALSALGGREIKHTGDGIMASFVSPAGAVRCAIQIQRELDKHAQANPERPLKVRVGAAAGEPVEQHNDLFGSHRSTCRPSLRPRATGTDPRFERNRRAVHWQRAFVRGRRRSDPQRLRFPSPRSCRGVEAGIGIATELDEEIFVRNYEGLPNHS